MNLFLVLLFQPAYFFALVGGEMAIGVFCARRLIGNRFEELPEDIRSAFSLLFGLMVHLYLVLAIGEVVAASGLISPHSSQLSAIVLRAGGFVGFLPWIIFPRATARTLKTLFPPLDPLFALFLALSVFFGISLFDSVSGITTPWVNNYGDLAFHLGLITSFVHGGNFPPTYPIFAGEPLSYPIIADLWSAVIWMPFPRFEALDVVFLCQWVVLWTAIYRILSASGSRLAVWAVLFGGGPLPYLAGVIDHLRGGPAQGLAHELIEKGYPWAPFISTIWVTQRPLLVGATVLLAAVRLLTELLSDRALTARRLSAPFILLSFGFLAHGHTALIGLLYCTSIVAMEITRSNDRAVALKTAVIAATISGLPLLVSLPLIWGKHGIIGWAEGWMPWATDLPGPSGVLIGSIKMWIANAAPVALLFIYLAWRSTHRTELSILALLFIFCNLTQFAVWNWDQLKMFIALYLLLIFVAANEPTMRGSVGRLLFLSLCLCGAVETVRSFVPYADHTIYTRQVVQDAEEIRRLTSPDAIIAVFPYHNSVVTLTGRRIFCGYEGTLSSHGINYLERSEASKSLSTLIPALREEASKAGVTAYVLSGQEDTWGNPADFANDLGATKMANLFEVLPEQIAKQSREPIP